ncbi:MAG TPA: SLC13 family permease [Limnochordales bacterium]
MQRVIAFVALVGAVALVTWLTGFTPAQILSVTVFSAFIVGTLLYWPFRLAFALLGVAILLAARLVDIPHLVEFASLDVILFLIGMMIVIGFLEERHFFEAVVERALPYVGGSAYTLLGAVMLMAFVSAALVDEVTSILFMSAIVLRIARRFQLNPVPYLIMTVFATNIGSAATVVGNPIGVLIALRAGLSFPDFLRWATPIALAALVVTVLLSFLYYRRPIAQLQRAVRSAGTVSVPHDVGAQETAAAGAQAQADPVGREDARPSLVFPGLLFLGTVAGLVLHKQIEHWMHLESNTMLVGVALAAAGIVLFVERQRARELVERRVDWWTLAFFLLLFASAGTLRYVGVTEHIARGMVAATGGSVPKLLVAITWSIGALTAVMDNVLAVASFIPIVGDLAAQGIPVQPLWWGMLFGGTILGNLTLIGSTANIVVLGLLERQERRAVGFMEWFWPGALTAIPSLVLATLLLYLQLPLLVG